MALKIFITIFIFLISQNIFSAEIKFYGKEYLTESEFQELSNNKEFISNFYGQYPQEKSQVEEKERVEPSFDWLIIKKISDGTFDINDPNLYDINSTLLDHTLQTSMLHIACFYKNLDAVKSLLNRDVKVDLKDKNGYTALMLATFFGNDSIVEELATRSNLSLENKFGESAHDIAKKHLNKAIQKRFLKLLKKRQSINNPD